ncbi:MAG: tetratricopeptide (TPR) repeat protein [Myxococcota bacterium]|jgi:tetratricopeptide (TPR) repeat protein
MLNSMSDLPALVLARMADDVAVGREVRSRAEQRLSEQLCRVASELGGHCPRGPFAGGLAVFSSHEAALECVVAVREASASRIMRPRLAVHAGLLEHYELPDGDVWVDGPAVHQAARLASIVRPGQAVVSARVIAAPPPGWQRDDTGHHELVGVIGQLRLDRMRADGEEVDWMPPVRSQAVVGGNLVPREEALIGRSADLAALTELQELGVRVITVVGEPGVGGSRLCREVALTSRGASGGVWWCDAQNGALIEVLRAAGEALGVPLVLGRTLADGVLQVGHALAARGASLLVLDGVDSLSGDVARVIRTWCESAPECRFLVHAPDRLGVPGEVAYRLAPPPETESLRILQLALRRVGLDPVDESVGLGLVRTLGRNPFAIGLLAPLLAHVPAAELVVRLRATTGGPLRTLAIVWNQLEPAARKVLTACAVFPVSADRTSILELVDDGTEVADALIHLERASLVRSRDEARAAGVERFSMDARVRRFVLGRLDEERRQALLHRFAVHVLARAEPWSERVWDGDGPEVLARLELVRDDLLAIAHWALSHPEGTPDVLAFAVRAVLCLQPLFLSRGPFPQQRQLLDEVLEQCADHPDLLPGLQVRLLLARVDSRRLRGRHARARTDLSRAMSLAGRAGDTGDRVRCLYAKGMLAFESGDAAAAATALERSATLASRRGMRRDAAMAGASLGVVHLLQGRLTDAEQILEQALAEFRTLGSRHFEGIAVGNLGGVLRASGRFEAARECFRRAVALHRETGERRLEALRVANLGALDMEIGKVDDAREAWEEAIVLAREVGDRRAEASGLEAHGMIALERGQHLVARAHLSEALAVYRLARDATGEGTAMGYLGLTDHRAGQRDTARESYFAAITQLREGDEGVRCGMFLAWLGALEAEDGELMAAQAAFDEAHQLLGRGTPLLDVLEASLDLLNASRDPNGGDTYRSAAALRLDRAPAKMGSDLRVAMAHVSGLLGRAAVVISAS